MDSQMRTTFGAFMLAVALIGGCNRADAMGLDATPRLAFDGAAQHSSAPDARANATR